MPSTTRTCRGHERHQKERRDAITQNGLSFLRIVDAGAINCKCGAPFLIVYISTVSVIQHGFDAAQRWVQRSKQSELFADAIITVWFAGR
jgi:hypothetical protein